VEKRNGLCLIVAKSRQHDWGSCLCLVIQPRNDRMIIVMLHSFRWEPMKSDSNKLQGASGARLHIRKLSQTTVVTLFLRRKVWLRCTHRPMDDCTPGEHAFWTGSLVAASEPTFPRQGAGSPSGTRGGRKPIWY